MNITALHCTNFKRFTDLRVGQIPAGCRLVLLIGSNGSGKSSIFDAFSFFDSAIKGGFNENQAFWEYFGKQPGQETRVSIWFEDGREHRVDSTARQIPALGKHTFYGRTSFRQIPRLTRTALGQGGSLDFQDDADRPRFFIDRDSRFENDIEKITETILTEFFTSTASSEQIKSKYIAPVNAALDRIFGGGNGTRLQLSRIIPPLEGKVAQVVFQKGVSELHYNYLSAGEKEVFNLLINLLSRNSLYQDTVYFLDEMDLHLNTRIQYSLLQEITQHWIPERSQLWTASHSLGFIEYARQAEDAAVIDFDDLDFDQPQVLYPSPKDHPELYEIAVGKAFLPSLFRHMQVWFVENKDRAYYAELGMPDTVFISDHNRNSVYHKARTTPYHGIADRDFLSDEDLELIRKHYRRLRILEYYSIENYLYHPENLAAHWDSRGVPFDIQRYTAELTEAKNQVSHLIIPSLSLRRTEYPYFGEPEFMGSPLQNRFRNRQENTDQAVRIAQELSSDVFETFYKYLPMKSYCTQLTQRQHIPPHELARTAWFRSRIAPLLQASEA